MCSTDTRINAYSFPLILFHLQMINLHKGGRARLLSVSCPVNVELTDADGNVLARFNSHSLVSSDREKAMSFTDGESDYMLLPDGEYNVKITATDNGAMNLNIVELSGDENTAYIDVGNVSGSASYSNVAPAKGETWIMSFLPASSAAKWILYNPEGQIRRADLVPNPIYLPAALTVIKEEAYLDAKALTGNYVCPDTLTAIGARAFADSGISGIYIPENCEIISTDAFKGIRPVIYCIRDSAAHDFAVDQGLDFVLVE